MAQKQTRNMPKAFAMYFLRGLLVFVPAVLTVIAIGWVLTSMDRALRAFFKIEIPGLSLVLTVLLIAAVGFLASNYLGRKLFGLIDSLFNRLPVVKLLYGAIRDFVQAFAGDKKSFDKPVVVELIKDGPKAMGFVTRDDMDFLGVEGHVAVYFPQSYNFAGQVLLFPRERVRPMTLASSEAMTLIVSGGVAASNRETSGKTTQTDERPQ